MILSVRSFVVIQTTLSSEQFDMNRSVLLLLALFVCVDGVHGVVFGWLLHINTGVQGKNGTNATAVQSEVQALCRNNKACGKGKYCHKHYGRCEDCKAAGMQCRRHHVCRQGMECVFGRCREAIPRGSEGGRCRKDNNCNKGLCCARIHGEKICKPLLEENAECSVPEGGLAYSLNSRCSCAEGLTCKRVKNQTKVKRRLLWNSKRARRCQKL